MNATLPLLARTPEEMRAALQSLRAARPTATCGLVPTMGALHAGHARLMQRARAENDLLAVSIFVNPLQFGPNEDYASYPRSLEADLQLCAQQGVDVVFAPTEASMYPQGYATRVSVPGVSDTLDGLARPGHFTGVATVVLKLLNIIQPTRAYFGEKDWQQVSVLRRMVTDLNVPVELVAVPTVRAEAGDDAGLALSSRNQYLTAEQRTRATVLSRALRAVQASYQSGERNADALLQAGRDVLAQESETKLDYLALVDENMQPIDTVTPETVQPEYLRGGAPRLLIAARLFGVRLIDNMPLVAINGGEQNATQ